METIDINIHVAEVPCPEEYYMGCVNQYKAYNISIPKELIPKEVLEAIDINVQNKRIQSMAIFDNNENKRSN